MKQGAWQAHRMTPWQAMGSQLSLCCALPAADTVSGAFHMQCGPWSGSGSGSGSRGGEGSIWELLLAQVLGAAHSATQEEQPGSS